MSDIVIESDCDDDNLYVAYGYLDSSIDPMENEYLVTANNLFRKDFEAISVLGMKSLMRFQTLKSLLIKNIQMK